jgi:Methyltransferase domain
MGRMKTAEFIALLAAAFEQGFLVKCTLSRATDRAPDGLKNAYLRPVELKKGLKIAVNHRYATRDEVKNYDLAEATILLEHWLGTAFLNADLFTHEQHSTLSFDKNGDAQLQHKTISAAVPAPTQHNREKQRLLSPTLPWLHALGVTNAKGDVLSNMHDKWRQINKYAEILDSLLREQSLPPDAHLADMGSGKGYLTFALYQLWCNRNSAPPNMTGIELRPALVDKCNEIAQQADFQQLKFVAADINHWQTERLDVLIALHACDVATDMAIAKGIHAGAALIVTAPCCHKQVRRDLHTQNELAPILRYGILEERQAEILTDGIRALLLEAHGYHTKVFEFISTEHTAKNVMITAQKDPKSTFAHRKKALEQVAQLKAGFGLKTHFLETLLPAH